MPVTEQVWIVDDDSSIRWVMEKALSRAGLSCRAFENGNDVMDALAQEEPMVVVSDIRMPGMDGIVLLSQIKAQQPDLPVIITTAALAERLPPQKADVVVVDRDAELVAGRPSSAPEVAHDPESLAYIIYTSGSTGTPKGIAIRHRGALNNIHDLNTRYGVGPDDCLMVMSSLSFDMCVYEILGTLMAGAKMIVTDPERGADPAHWAELTDSHQVTVWNSAPQLLELFVSHVEGMATSPSRRLRLTILGGDWVPVSLPERFKAISAEGARVIVLGGATEASIHSTVFEVTQTDPAWKSIPYGRPMYNQSCYVLDRKRRLCPVGVPGELHLGGVGLARGIGAVDLRVVGSIIVSWIATLPIAATLSIFFFYFFKGLLG